MNMNPIVSISWLFDEHCLWIYPDISNVNKIQEKDWIHFAHHQLYIILTLLHRQFEQLQRKMLQLGLYWKSDMPQVYCLTALPLYNSLMAFY